MLRNWLNALRRHVHMRRTLTHDLSGRIAGLKERVANHVPSTAAPRVADVDSALDQALAGHRRPKQVVEVGRFDQDGAFLSLFGPIRGLSCVDEAQFNPRSGCALSLVDMDGRLGVRKEFGTRRGRFVQELEAVVDLRAAGCPVPPLLGVDWAGHAITLGFVHGDVIREMLARAGARVRDRDVQQSPRENRREARIRSGRRQLCKVVSESQIKAIAAGLEAIHRAGYVLDDVKYGNIILAADSGLPVFIDFERALPIAHLPPQLADYLRGLDRRKFVEHFGPPRDSDDAR